MVGTVGTRPLDMAVALMWQGIELFPPSHIFGGNSGNKKCRILVCSHLFPLDL